jgi:hypothetical protein
MTTVHATSAQLSAYPAAKSRTRTFAREIVFIAAAALLYSLVRGLTDDRVGVAFSNAERVIAFERAIGLFVEPDLQSFALRNDVVPNLANAVYIAYWPIIIGTVLWLLVRHPRAYPLYRNALLTSGGLSLVLFALVPLAPPRFLPEHGFTDTIAANSDGYREFNASALVNEYAAMPSLHFGWVLLASIAIARLTTNQLARVAAIAAPVLMLAAIVLTGNHYFVDAAAGGAVVLGGLAIASAIARARQVRTSSGRDVSSGPGPSLASRP